MLTLCNTMVEMPAQVLSICGFWVHPSHVFLDCLKSTHQELRFSPCVSSPPSFDDSPGTVSSLAYFIISLD